MSILIIKYIFRYFVTINKYYNFKRLIGYFVEKKYFDFYSENKVIVRVIPPQPSGLLDECCRLKGY
jgi:hypothetical protein